MKFLIAYRFTFVALCFATLFLTSCAVEDSADVNQDRVYSDYEVFYNSNTDKTWVIARFRFGGPAGTLLELNMPASITYNGEELPFNPFFGGHQKEYAGRLTGGTFRYTDADGNIFENTVPVYESIAFPSGMDSLSKSAAYALEWDGSVLAPDQRVGIFIGSWTWGQDALFMQDADGADEVVMGTNQLGNLPEGPSTLFMDRTTEVDVTEGTSRGGKIRGKYRATNMPIMVVE